MQKYKNMKDNLLGSSSAAAAAAAAAGSASANQTPNALSSVVERQSGVSSAPQPSPIEHSSLVYISLVLE
jgi:hypothetical protein